MADQRIPAPAPDDGAGPAAAMAADAPAQPVQDPRETKSGPETTDWRSELPAELRKAAEKFKSPADVVKSYASLERRLGRSVVVPDQSAGREEIEAFYARLGRPETPDGYEFRIPDDVPDHLRPQTGADTGRQDFLARMHEAGATQATVQAAIDWYYGAISQTDRELDRVKEEARADAEAELHRDWGAAYGKNIELARRAARHFGGEELLAAFEKAGLADDPVCLRAFCRIGAASAEDGLLSGGSGPMGSAQQRIDRLMGDHFGKASYASAEVQNELRDLYQQVYGDNASPA